jgi:hypothetical protein
MKIYKVGQVVPEFIGHNEETKFDVDDGGATMFVFFSNPTEKEKKQFESGARFEIRFVELHGVIIMTVKIGNLAWMDAPYTPHLTPNLTRLQIPNEGEGLALTIILVDTNTGKIEHIRLVGLAEGFSRKLIGTIMEHKMKDFDREEYLKTIQTIFRRYTTNQIVKLSKDCCKIN